jgi:hypothetical protein
VLLRERPFDDDPDIWVKLATARRHTRVGFSDVEAHVLGTDFAYDELRTWTPRFITAAKAFKLDSACDGSSVVVLRAEWLYRRRTWISAVASVSREHGLVTDVTWDDGRGDKAFKTLRAEGIGEIDGVWMPSCIRVQRASEGYESRMELHEAHVGRHLQAQLFEPSALSEVHDTLVAEMSRK